MLFTFPINPSTDEERKRVLVEEIIIGNGNRDKYLADATHVVEAGARHGYFITTDGRINDKRDELKEVCGVRVITPAEWLSLWDCQ
ncbi:hypothetical protein [Rugamonas apoptosis]|nr:hypothetical protein [Rugamonas apoptosis]